MNDTKIKPKSFLDPTDLLAQIPVKEGAVVADFGSGNGYYSVAAAKMAGAEGQVYAVDIMEDALSQTASRAKLEGLYNLSTIHCDLETTDSCGLEDTSCDLVIVAGILHQTEDREAILRQVYRVLKTGGQALVVDWKADAVIGPPKPERISEEEVGEVLEGFGFRPLKELRAGSFHFALLYEK